MESGPLLQPSNTMSIKENSLQFLQNKTSNIPNYAMRPSLRPVPRDTSKLLSKYSKDYNEPPRINRIMPSTLKQNRANFRKDSKETKKDVKKPPLVSSTQKQEMLRKLTPMQYKVTQEKVTERPYSNKYYKHWERGFYSCVVCSQPIFLSKTKYDSGSGWPAFYDIINSEKVNLKQDLSHIGANVLLLVCNPSLARTEVSCATCGAHLGHLFDDGPKPTGKRFCVNSSSLQFNTADGPIEMVPIPQVQESPKQDNNNDKSTSCFNGDKPVIHLANPNNSCGLGARMCFRVSNLDSCKTTQQSS